MTTPSNRCDSLGFGLGFDLTNRDPGWKEKGKGRAEKHTSKTPGRYHAVMDTQEMILRLATDRGIEIIFITTPAWTSYIEALDREQLAEMEEGIEEIKGKFGVAYYDFLRDKRFTESDFYDPDHLSDIGAVKFSKILADTINF